MADNDSSSSKRRRLKAPSETVRQRQSSTASQLEQPKRQPVRRVLRTLAWPFRRLAALKLWRAKGFRPVRFIGRWLGLILWPPYFRSSFRELKLVTWPDFRQSWRLTFAVLAFAVVFGAFIAGVDFGLDKLFKQVLLK